MADVSYPLAFLGGVVSFLSPCVFPLVPAYVSLVTGLSFEELRASGKHKTGTIVAKTIAFILGFTVIFVVLGASSSLLGRLFLEYQEILRIAGGIVIILFGLLITGIVNTGFLIRERRFHFTGGTAGYIGTFFVGLSFGAGWTPCIGPILGTILIYAGSQGSAAYGFKLLAVYSLGLAVPFLLSALALNVFLRHIQRLHRSLVRSVMIGSGVILIIFGILLLMNKVGQLASFFPNLEPRL